MGNRYRELNTEQQDAVDLLINSIAAHELDDQAVVGVLAEARGGIKAAWRRKSGSLRSEMLRMASGLPVGDPTRRKLLAAVQGKTARESKTIKSMVSIKPKNFTTVTGGESGTLIGELATWEDTVKFEADIHMDRNGDWVVKGVHLLSPAEPLIKDLVRHVLHQDPKFISDNFQR